MEEKNIYQKLQEVRCEVQSRVHKKNGKGNAGGKFNYTYFSLKDFLSVSNESMRDHGLCPLFNIYINHNADGSDEEFAELNITDGKNAIRFVLPTANVQMTTPIQGLGAKNTYMKRYLYLNALELEETDVIEELAKAEAVPEGDPIKNAKIDVIKKNHNVTELKAICELNGVHKIQYLSDAVLEDLYAEAKQREEWRSKD